MKFLLPVLSLSAAVNALHFFIDGTTPSVSTRSFPRIHLLLDTTLLRSGTSEYQPGSSTTESASTSTSTYEIFDNDHRVVSQRGLASGRFTFSAADAGDHKICFTPSSSSGRTSWLSAKNPNGGIKLTLDLVIGETNQIESSDKGKIQDITSRVKDLNARLADIRREQVFQREREAEFRDQSESTNARVIRWIVIQLIVLGITCTWQLSHLRSFFIKQKLT
ncbi:Protein ERP1 [Fusarium culmorum]|uniref:Protein ERP1 n=1 Tax=Fusarium culmorum TaxID=5516 RepID=A0A2T4GIF5_FUSCU|nr:Protein ERP1 [Fusarium culmorum]